MTSSEKEKETNEIQEAVCSGLTSAAGFCVVRALILGPDVQQLGQDEPWDRMEHIELE